MVLSRLLEVKDLVWSLQARSCSIVGGDPAQTIQDPKAANLYGGATAGSLMIQTLATDEPYRVESVNKTTT